MQIHSPRPFHTSQISISRRLLIRLATLYPPLESRYRAHVVTTAIPRRENLESTLTKAASRTYLAFSTYIESWAWCRMLRRPPRIKQIKTSGGPRRLINARHSQERKDSPLFVHSQFAVGDASEIALAFSTDFLLPGILSPLTRVSRLFRRGSFN